jgi:hypothetical protein
MNTTRLLRLPFAIAFLFLATVFAQAQQTRTWLMLNLTSQESFFVTDPAERASLTAAGWKTNGEGCLLATAQAESAPLQRLVKSTDKGVDRVFAISPEQLSAATKDGYVNEGTLGEVSPKRQNATMIPVYHFTQDARNLWLIDKADRAWAEKAGWKFKGVAFWLWPKGDA